MFTGRVCRCSSVSDNTAGEASVLATTFLLQGLPSNAGRIDDPPSRSLTTSIRLPWLLLHHLCKGIFATEPHASTVHSHVLIKVLRLHGVATDRVVVRRLGGNASIVAYDVQATGPAHCFVDHPLYVGFLSDITRKKGCGSLAVLLPNLFFNTARSQVCDNDLGSGVRELDSGGSAYAGAATSDDGYAVLQASIHDENELSRGGTVSF